MDMATQAQLLEPGSGPPEAQAATQRSSSLGIPSWIPRYHFRMQFQQSQNFSKFFFSTRSIGERPCSWSSNIRADSSSGSLSVSVPTSHSLDSHHLAGYVSVRIGQTLSAPTRMWLQLKLRERNASLCWPDRLQILLLTRSEAKTRPRRCC